MKLDWMAARVHKGLPRPSLRVVLIVPFVLQIAAAVGLTGWLSLQNGQQAVNEVAHKLRQEVSDRIEQKLNEFLTTPHLVNQLNQNAIQLGYIDPQDPQSLYRHFYQQAQEFSSIEAIFFGSVNGEFVGNGRFNQGKNQLMIAGPSQENHIRFYDVNAQGQPTQLVNDTPNFITPNRPWYQAAVRAGKPVWGEIFTYHAYPVMAIPAVAPVYGTDGKLVGVLGNNFFLSQISDFLQTIEVGQSGQTFIIERSGLLVASSTLDRPFQLKDGIPQRLNSMNESDPLLHATSQFLLKVYGDFRQINQSAQLEFEIDGQRQFLQVVPYRNQAGLDWLIIVVAPESDFMAQINTNRQTTIALCLGSLVLATGLGILTTHGLTHSLLRLNQAAKEIAQGNLQPAIATDSIREVGELSQSFNQMILQLQSSFTQLQESEDLFRSLFEQARVGIVFCDSAGRILRANQKYCEITSYSATELCERSFFEFTDPVDRIQNRLVFQRMVSGQADYFTMEKRYIRQDGSRIWVDVTGSIIRDSLGQPKIIVGIIEDISDRKRAEEQLIYNALHDALTDLPNRNLLTERLELAIHRVQRSPDYQFALLFLDLDRFKVINDSLGHAAGDQLLMAIAQTLQSIIRNTDLAVRLGGDEFVILLEEIDGIQEAVRIAERIFTALQTPLLLDGREVFVSTSIGIVLGSQDYAQASDLLRNADIAMYRAKAQGRAKYSIFDAEMHTQALRRLHLENDLRKALERQEFMVHYQPIVALKTGQLIGFEALVRWLHPTHGYISPVEFIPVAEETGLIVPLDRWILETVCQQFASWQTRFPAMSFLKVSVNLSVRDLLGAHLVEEVDQILSQTGLPENCLTLEITESMLIENVADTTDLLIELKGRGIQISIDDFGTGYSSLSYLHRLPVDTLKIDRSFVSHMQEGGRNHQIVETIVALSNQLGLAAIAEGIETLQQLEQLQQLGCEFGQGYWFAEPLTPDAVEKLLGQKN